MSASTLDTKSVDLADVWLERGLEHLLDACTATEHERCVDASRQTIAFTSMAVESRINRVVREHDPDGWGGDAQLTPLEKFQLIPRLLHESDLSRHNELAELVVELFDLRDELVEASPVFSAFDPRTARGSLVAGAELCEFLDVCDEVAHRVHESAVKIRAAAAERQDDSDFPPDIVGS